MVPVRVSRESGSAISDSEATAGGVSWLPAKPFVGVLARWRVSAIKSGTYGLTYSADLTYCLLREVRYVKSPIRQIK